MSSYAEAVAGAVEAAQAGDLQTAFFRMRGALSWPGPEADEELYEGLGIMARIVAPMAGLEVAGLFESAARGPDLRRLRDLAHGMMDMGLAAMALPVLERCRRLAPDNDAVLLELVTAFDAIGAPQPALAALRAQPAALARQSGLRHALAVATAQTGDLEALPGLLGSLGAPEGDEQRLIQAWLQRTLIRAGLTRPLTGLDRGDLRGWQYALTGTLLLHISEHGHPEPMAGRYAWVQDSPGTVRLAVDRLARVLKAMGPTPPVIVPLPDRDSEILARIAGDLLGLPVRPWPIRGVPAPALVVAYDMREADPGALAVLFQRAPGQVLWSHVGCWTEGGPIAPDIVSFLAQYAVSPWGETLTVDPETQAVSHREADGRSVEEIAGPISALPAPEAEAGPLDDLAALDALARADAGLPERRPRERWTLGSPVPSARFA